MPKVRNIVLGSCLLAMVAQLGIVAAGLGQTGTSTASRRLDFGRGIVHEMALTFVVVAAADWSRAAGVAPGVVLRARCVPAMLTGVRSALLALLVVMLIYILRLGLNAAPWSWSSRSSRSRSRAAPPPWCSSSSTSRRRPEPRFRARLPIGEESGCAAVTPSWNFGPVEVAVRDRVEVGGRGRAAHDGTIFVGPSDLIEVGVELGLVALVISGLLSVALLPAPLENIVLVPLIVYALVDGSIEGTSRRSPSGWHLPPPAGRRRRRLPPAGAGRCGEAQRDPRVGQVRTNPNGKGAWRR